jgi:hypothetical protein
MQVNNKKIMKKQTLFFHASCWYYTVLHFTKEIRKEQKSYRSNNLTYFGILCFNLHRTGIGYLNPLSYGNRVFKHPLTFCVSTFIIWE